jgi:hypothetical protein
MTVLQSTCWPSSQVRRDGSGSGHCSSSSSRGSRGMRRCLCWLSYAMRTGCAGRCLQHHAGYGTHTLPHVAMVMDAHKAHHNHSLVTSQTVCQVIESSSCRMCAACTCRAVLPAAVVRTRPHHLRLGTPHLPDCADTACCLGLRHHLRPRGGRKPCQSRTALLVWA